MERKNWNDTTPEERITLLSPFECALIERVREGRTVHVVGDREDLPAVTFSHGER